MLTSTMCAHSYYTAATGPEEWWQPHAPVWNAVGRYARFNQEVSALAEEYVRILLDVEKGAKTPEVSISYNPQIETCLNTTAD